MHRKPTRALSRIVMGVLLCLSSIRVVSAAENEDFTALKLDISIAESAYLLGEPITAEFRLSNETATPVMGHKKIDSAFGFLRLMISREGRAFRKLNSVKVGLIRPRPRA